LSSTEYSGGISRFNVYAAYGILRPTGIVVNAKGEKHLSREAVDPQPTSGQHQQRVKLSPDGVFSSLRWFALFGLCFWLWCYWSTWGAATFLRLCDIAVILTSLGILLKNRLLISSQAISSIVIFMLWDFDVAWRLIFRKHLIGGTEYMWDNRFPLFMRLLSLFHLFLPVLQVWALSRVGYERRALRLQVLIAGIVLTTSYFVRSDLNLNFARRDPFCDTALGPVFLHLPLTLTALVCLAYWPTHRLLSFFESPDFGGTQSRR